MTENRPVFAWTWDGRNSEKRGITKGHRTFWEVMEMFIVLNVVMKSHLYSCPNSSRFIL